MVEEDELLIPIKYPNGTRKIQPLAVQVHPAAGLHMAELFGTNRRRAKGEYRCLQILNQCSGQNKLVNVGSNCSRRRKISDFKTRVDGAL